MDANKATGKDPAIQIRAELALDKAGNVPIPFALSREKRFEMSGDDSIERAFFGIARPVDGIDCHEGI